MAHEERPLWQCPECGERLTGRNMAHSCGRFELEPLFTRCEPHVLPLFHRLAERVAALGAVRTIPQKSRVCFQVRVRFASVQVRKSHLVLGLWLAEPIDSPRFTKVERYGSGCWYHYLKLEGEEELDDELARWLRAAYEVGC